MKPLVYLFVLACCILMSLNFTAKKKVSPRFNHVMLYVSDLDASIEFYESAFDIEMTQKVDELVEITGDGEHTRNVKMAFLKFPGQDFVFELSERKTGGSESKHYQHVGIDVMDIEASSDRLKKAGASNFSGIRHLRANDTEVFNCFFTGPDGESIELMQILRGEF